MNQHTTTPRHTILGATGVIGIELARSLRSSGTPVRLVSRSPRATGPSDEAVAADLLDPDATDRAIAGSEVAYLVAGLQYDTAVWQEQWPRIMHNVIAACKRHATRLVFFDNVYAYGRVDGPMTEETPFNPVSRKGEVRARIATTLLEEVRRGDVQALIARAADFYGPGAALAMVNATVFDRLKQGKSPQWVGSPKRVHTFTYTPDAGAAVARLGRDPVAFGQTWHVPTSGELITGEQFVRLACELAGQPYRLQAAPSWLLRLMGIFNPVLRENQEMMYQFEHDYVFSSAKIERAYGLRATSYAEGIRQTLQNG